MTLSLIIAAGGSGKRFGSEIPKQFLELKGLPIILRTINAFYKYNSAFEVVVAINKDYIAYFETLVSNYNFKNKIIVVEGGETRFHSVKNALNQSTGNLVFIHDAVRPLVNSQLIERCKLIAEKTDSAIPVIPINDSIREINNEKSIAVNRNNYVLVQTPQTFKAELLKKAYQQSYCNSFTDDASVWEKAGYKINTVLGDISNIKITTEIDMEFLNIYLNK